MSAVLPSDHALPALARLFDTSGMLASLQPAADGAAAELDCEIERVKYRPNRNCVVAYRLSAARAPTRRLAVCMYRASEADERFARAVSIDPGARLLPELNAVVWRFPYDRKLPALPLLADASQARGLWLDSIVQSCWPRRQLGAIDSRVVSFFPEHGATFRFDVALRRRGQPDIRKAFFGKTRYDDDGADAFKVMTALRADAEERGVAACCPRALLYDGERRVLWQEAIAAPTLNQLLDGNADIDWRTVARAIARLHASRLELPATRSFADLLPEIDRAVAVCGTALPESAAQANRLRQALLRRQPITLPRLALVHGDLHSKNILLRAGRVWLIDFDRVTRGDPLADIASLAAELLYRDCVAARSPRWQRAGDLLRAYCDATRCRGSAVDLRWHVAAALLRERVYRVVTSLKPGRIDALPRLLTVAELVMERAPWT
jgi:streptomycin 6-kinase